MDRPELNPELSDHEIQVGALHVYYPAEDRMIFVAPIEALMMRSMGSIFGLTPDEAKVLKEKAVRLEEKLISLGR